MVEVEAGVETLIRFGVVIWVVGVDIFSLWKLVLII